MYIGSFVCPYFLYTMAFGQIFINVKFSSDMWTIHLYALKFQGHNLQFPSFLLRRASNNNSPIRIMNFLLYYEPFNYVKGYKGLKCNTVCVLTMLQRRS
jgi:hypothetical protein